MRSLYLSDVYFTGLAKQMFLCHYFINELFLNWIPKKIYYITIYVCHQLSSVKSVLLTLSLLLQLRTVHISPLPSYTSTSQSSKPVVMWVPSSCYRSPHDSQHRWCTVLLQCWVYSMIWQNNIIQHNITSCDMTYSNMIEETQVMAWINTWMWINMSYYRMI